MRFVSGWMEGPFERGLPGGGGVGSLRDRYYGEAWCFSFIAAKAITGGSELDVEKRRAFTWMLCC